MPAFSDTLADVRFAEQDGLEGFHGLCRKHDRIFFYLGFLVVKEGLLFYPLFHLLSGLFGFLLADQGGESGLGQLNGFTEYTLTAFDQLGLLQGALFTVEVFLHLLSADSALGKESGDVVRVTEVVAQITFTKRQKSYQAQVLVDTQLVRVLKLCCRQCNG